MARTSSRRIGVISVRIAGAAHQQVHEAARIGPERQVGDRIRIGQLEIALPQVRHDADDGRRQRHRNAALRRRAALQIDRQRDAAADRIFVREVQRREALVDDRALAPGHAVFVGQVAAALQRQADGLEVARIDRQHRHVRRLLALIERLAVDRQLAQEAALHRRVAGDRDGLDLRVRLQPLFEPLVEGQPLLERRDTSARAAPAPSSAASTCRCRDRGGTSSGSCAS